MASSVSGQDEPNRALWLATRAGKMEPSCPLGTTRCIPQAKFHQKPYNKSFIDQVCSVKMAGYWPRSFFASLWTSTSSRSINTQKKNLANIQPSWPHTWSITHTYCYSTMVNFFFDKLLKQYHAHLVLRRPTFSQRLFFSSVSQVKEVLEFLNFVFVNSYGSDRLSVCQNILYVSLSPWTSRIKQEQVSEWNTFLPLAWR